MKGAIDVTFNRRKLYTPKKRPFAASGSVNHKIAAATLYGLYYGDWQPLLNFLKAFKEHGLFCLGPNADETCTTSYLPFYVSHLMMALMRTAPDPKKKHVAEAVLECIGCILWWMAGCAYKGSIYSPGLRVYQQDTPPNWYVDRVYDALRGKPVPIHDKNMDNDKGRRNKAGYPISHAIWLTLIAQERGLLRDLWPHAIKIKWGLTVEYLPHGKGMMAYFSEPVTQKEHDALLAVYVSPNGSVQRWDAHTPAQFDRGKAVVSPLSL